MARLFVCSMRSDPVSLCPLWVESRHHLVDFRSFLLRRRSGSINARFFRKQMLDRPIPARFERPLLGQESEGHRRPLKIAGADAAVI